MEHRVGCKKCKKKRKEKRCKMTEAELSPRQKLINIVEFEPSEPKKHRLFCWVHYFYFL